MKQGETVLGEYAYDAFGRRVKKVISGIPTIYHYDIAGNLIAESAGGGTPSRDVVYLNGERVAMKLYGSQAGWYFFINDHLGTPQKIVNEAGQVVWAGFYQPFGKAWAYPADITNNFRFPGQYYDAETGLHYNWNRYYDPDTGRYITADPIGLEGGINLYAYVMGNPVNMIDPDGEIPLALILGIVKAALSLYDAYNTAETLTDPDASLSEKGAAAGLFIIGMTVTGGYSAGARACKSGISNTSKITLSELRNLLKQWDKSTFKTLSDSIRYHAGRHGDDDIIKYLRKAANFNKKGAQKVIRSDGSVLYRKKSGEFLIERDGKIISYGEN